MKKSCSGFMGSMKKHGKDSLLVYPHWHPGKSVAWLECKKNVYLCATYSIGMDMRGYRPYILEYEEV